MEGFRAKYRIPQGVSLQYCSPDQVLTHRNEGGIVIPMIAFIEGGMTLPIGSITRDYLHNLFRILGAVDALNQHLGLGLT